MIQKTARSVTIAILLLISFVASSLFIAVATERNQSYIIKNEQQLVVQTKELDRFVVSAKKIIDQEKAAVGNSMRSAKKTTYNYISFSAEGVPLIYEDTHDGQKPKIVMLQKKQKSGPPRLQPNGTLDESAQTQGFGFIPDGVGSRVKINGGRASYMSTLVTTATPNQVYIPEPGNQCPDHDGRPGGQCMAWIYGGFHSTVAADMGVVLSDKLGTFQNEYGYKPFLTIYGGSELNPVYDEVQYANGYLPGSDINQYYFRNVSGFVRLKLAGTAMCADLSCSDSSDTHLITIMDSKKRYNLTGVNYWKIVTTVTSLNDQGINQADFASIRLDGNFVPRSAFQQSEKDHAMVYRDANLKYSIRVNHLLY